MNSSGRAVNRALYDLLLLLDWYCVETAPIGVCVRVDHCSGACHVLAGLPFFCMGFQRGITCFCWQVLNFACAGVLRRLAAV